MKRIRRLTPARRRFDLRDYFGQDGAIVEPEPEPKSPIVFQPVNIGAAP